MINTVRSKEVLSLQRYNIMGHKTIISIDQNATDQQLTSIYTVC